MARYANQSLFELRGIRGRRFTRLETAIVRAAVREIIEAENRKPDDHQPNSNGRGDTDPSD